MRGTSINIGRSSDSNSGLHNCLRIAGLLLLILANILGLLIVYTGFGIFKESIFTLSDGFNEQDLEEYRLDILEVEDVIDVNNIKGRYHGSSIFIDVTIVVDPYLSLYEAHQICDKVEIHLHNK